MLQHDDVELPDQNVGGRLTLKEQQEAVRFYRSVIEGNVEDDDDDSDDASCSPSVPVEKPKLPMQQNGKKHHYTDMRAILKEMGKSFPCKGCANAKDCCKDPGVCAYFDEFDCGEGDVDLGSDAEGGNEE
ncbi:hypothetical protein AJ80_09843 [Polytolypa hystricis UAMH7299]|uniref:Uncharacterized protein n=1 Tax=Polytolypa hystricis (strain UAMH7299) TaxID=1447883 RepID=A0A2B7WHU7_POLH7|nr:hypothetical protein AJ80_09843 [Polytolypa hystricis UAMH7299]